MPGPPCNSDYRYHVVEFLHEKTTYVVPDSWVTTEGETTWCFWPLCVDKMELTKMLQKRVPVEKTWNIFEARILSTKSE
ncbi:hypothetical protein V5799_014928 [Amblyomma americanum]|uniref:Uncharacterized protein n=1 Tax=Amblyomma americanum TaxID=6943 RepID=A0AAQ4E1L7_AMBAM